MEPGLNDRLENSSERDFERAFKALRVRCFSELERLDSQMEQENANGEQRLKYLGGYLKTLQGIEEMAKRLRDERDGENDRGIDVVAFRQQLESQIAKLVDSDIASAVSGSPGPGDN